MTVKIRLENTDTHETTSSLKTIKHVFVYLSQWVKFGLTAPVNSPLIPQRRNNKRRANAICATKEKHLQKYEQSISVLHLHFTI